MNERFKNILFHLRPACMEHYGDRLVSVAVYGSVGRGTPRPDSDIDLLVVAEGLPDGRLKRMDDFRAIEKGLESRLSPIADAGGRVEFSPVIKSPDEVKLGSPLFLDMTEDAMILFDRDRFFEQALAGLRKRLERLGSKRIWRGNAWHWDLKPDYKPGEVFEL